jgi:hypothetical protein
MFSQYPDSIVVTVSLDPTETDGVYASGTATSYTFPGRAEENGSGRKLIGPDGSEIDYAFIYYMPATGAIIPEGSDFVLTKLNNAAVRGKVKRAVNGQLNSRLWL